MEYAASHPWAPALRSDAIAAVLLGVVLGEGVAAADGGYFPETWAWIAALVFVPAALILIGCGSPSSFIRPCSSMCRSIESSFAASRQYRSKYPLPIGSRSFGDSLDWRKMRRRWLRAVGLIWSGLGCPGLKATTSFLVSTRGIGSGRRDGPRPRISRSATVPEPFQRRRNGPSRGRFSWTIRLVSWCCGDGACRDRTGDPRLAKAVLSQLS